jgi:hypothetical protein
MDRRAPPVCVQVIEARRVVLWRRLMPSVIEPATQVQFPMTANVRAGLVASHLSSWPSPASKLKHVARAQATEGATRIPNTSMADGFMDLRPKVRLRLRTETHERSIQLNSKAAVVGSHRCKGVVARWLFLSPVRAPDCSAHALTATAGRAS